MVTKCLRLQEIGVNFWKFSWGWPPLPQPQTLTTNHKPPMQSRKYRGWGGGGSLTPPFFQPYYRNNPPPPPFQKSTYGHAMVGDTPNTPNILIEFLRKLHF